ncbi:F0F1 ATP synthase subunit B family protein [Novosphingobium rosa]|uniref:F0F1 ATP synthase subunit B family protein n=1 Tax=Novosphingobium rosa TaxID=76978 RepID=UPI0008302465|nr:ATPase [Novosphingobium rosa]
MPQISQLAETYASQIFWVLIFFGFVFFVIGKGMVPKVMETMAARDSQIAADLAHAEAARRAAEGADAGWQATAAQQRAQAHALIAAAKHDAAQASEARLHAAASVIDARVADAEARIGAAVTSAMAEIETVAAQAAGDIAQRLAGITVGEDSARAAVKEALHG